MNKSGPRKKRTMTASTLRMILSVALLLTIAAGVGMSYFVLRGLDNYAKGVNEVVVKAKESDDDVTRIDQLTQQLNQNREAFTKAKSVVAESKSYKYQNTIVEDIRDMANRAEVSVSSFDFATEEAASGSSSSGSSTSSGTTSTAATNTANGSLKTTSTTVTVEGPVSYRKMLNFINNIEQNLTKMQITDTSFSRDSEQPTLLGTQQITIEVYVQ